MIFIHCERACVCARAFNKTKLLSVSRCDKTEGKLARQEQELQLSVFSKNMKLTEE